ncbi:MAG: DUF538 domain-containing protein [Deltaproteobacteria bacterium]|nr:DUF538 domain-containing protein [Deltaproteobacteria bacterium]
MFIEKEPQKAVENKKAKESLAKEPVAEKAPAKQALKGLPYNDQVKAVSPREKKAPAGRTPEAVSAKDPVSELRKLFREMNVCDKLVPGNVVNFTYDRASGSIAIELRESFSRKFDAENTVTFERHVSGVLRKGSLSGLDGIRRGTAAIVEIERVREGVTAIRGKLGPFSKTVEFRDEQIPSLP